MSDYIVKIAKQKGILHIFKISSEFFQDYINMFLDQNQVVLYIDLVFHKI